MRRQEEERGRFLLRALLWLVFLLSLVSRGLALVPLDRRGAVNLAFSLLPLAVILWAVHRGSFPALVLLVVGAVQELGGLFNYFPYNMAELSSPSQAAAMLTLLFRVLAIGAVYTPSAVSGYLYARKQARTSHDLFLEIGLLVAALLLSLLPGLWAFLTL